jgi:hypothetical protein
MINSILPILFLVMTLVLLGSNVLGSILIGNHFVSKRKWRKTIAYSLFSIMGVLGIVVTYVSLWVSSGMQNWALLIFIPIIFSGVLLKRTALGAYIFLKGSEIMFAVIGFVYFGNNIA